MTSILIRCDASLLSGTGHVFRCRTLARELQRHGAEVSFMCRSQAGDLISVLKQEFAVLALPDQRLAACIGLKGRDLYDAWLGCTQDQDAADCLKACARVGIKSVDWVVKDHYGLDWRWEAKLITGLTYNAVSPKLFVIDDLADRRHQADLLLDQNYFGSRTENRYQNLVSANCHQLLGPKYALLSPEYALMQPLVPSRTELRRILIFFGGVDSENFTTRALQALLDPALDYLAVDVVMGIQSPNRQEVEELVAIRPNTTLHNPLPSLAGLIARADLAIGAGGATTWERACLGLPSLTTVIADNQLEATIALAKENCIVKLCTANFDRKVKHWLHHLTSHPDWICTASTRCIDFVRGRGVNIVCNHLMKDE